jgi:hypothetical protein
LYEHDVYKIQIRVSAQNKVKKKQLMQQKKYGAKLLTDFNDLHKHYEIDHVKEPLYNKENYLHLEHNHNIKHIEITK